MVRVRSQHEPTSFLEASKHFYWHRAIKDEVAALKLNNTQVLINLPSKVKPIGYKWVYHIKHRIDGFVELYKVCLVTKGYAQIKDVDYFETFSPVVKIATIRVILALASLMHWHIHQLNINNAFLHGELHEDVYMMVPLGVSTTRPNQCCKLLKSLYGLKQASRKWYEKLSLFAFIVWVSTGSD